MLKLIIGVILLIIILLTSYYILVENDSIKENFTTEFFSGGSDSCNYQDVQTAIYATEDQPISQKCCLDFMENEEDFYVEYSKKYDRKTFKEVHNGVLGKCFKNFKGKNHDIGSLFPQSDDNSHCEIYTSNCMGITEGQDHYIDKNYDKLALCNVDPNCKFQDHKVESCSNKCIRDLEISEGKDCNSDGCSNTTTEYRLKVECGQLSDEEKCNNNEYCKFVKEQNYCFHKCYTLNTEEQCNQHSDICAYSFGTCSPRQCDINDDEPLGDEKRNQYCIQKCYVNGDECPSKTSDECENYSNCKYSYYSIPKCVADNS